MTDDEYKALLPGTKIKYGFYKNVMYHKEHKDGKHVVMINESGATMRVYKDLFIKHAMIRREKMSETEFKVGDVACLKSGGPEMTVSKVENDEIWVEWFYRKELNQKTFKAAMCVAIKCAGR